MIGRHDILCAQRTTMTANDDTTAESETPIELMQRVTEKLSSRRKFLGNTAKVGAGGVALSAAGAGTAAAEGVATVTFDDQETTGTSVTVASVYVPEDGFVAIHDSSLLDGEVLDSVIGVSHYLESGSYEDVEVSLFEVDGAEFETDTLEEDQTLIAMPHEDTDGDEEYDFVESGGEDDGPYTADGEAVVDDAHVDVVEENDAEDDDAEDVSDIDILNYALTLEHLEAAYYNEFLDEYSESDVERSDVAAIFANDSLRYSTYQFVQAVRDHEEAHVETLTQTIEDLGGDPVEPAEYEFPYDSIEEFASLSATIEAVGVSAYAGAAPSIENDDLIPPALSIHSVEARHTSYFNVLDTTSPFPNAFDPARTMDEVLAIASDFIVSDE